MNHEVRDQLLAMHAEDQRVRTALEGTGELFDGYAPAMEAVHVRNADALATILDRHGWPGFALVGEDGARAAWLLLQHAISRPAFMRRCLPLLRAAAAQRDILPAWMASLEDRIACFEGRPQKYGTQFDWDERGELNPEPIEDPARVDELRASVGLNSLAERLLEVRRAAGRERPPLDYARRRQEADAWARSVGWR